MVMCDARSEIAYGAVRCPAPLSAYALVMRCPVLGYDCIAAADNDYKVKSVREFLPYPGTLPTRVLCDARYRPSVGVCICLRISGTERAYVATRGPTGGRCRAFVPGMVGPYLLCYGFAVAATLGYGEKSDTDGTVSCP
eukprot:3634413-Rhodomonas_salina.1